MQPHAASVTPQSQTAGAAATEGELQQLQQQQGLGADDVQQVRMGEEVAECMLQKIV